MAVREKGEMRAAKWGKWRIPTQDNSRLRALSRRCPDSLTRSHFRRNAPLRNTMGNSGPHRNTAEPRRASSRKLRHQVIFCGLFRRRFCLLSLTFPLPPGEYRALRRFHKPPYWSAASRGREEGEEKADSGTSYPLSSPPISPVRPCSPHRGIFLRNVHLRNAMGRK